ncbi:MAG: D-aminoacyl-tRNA deacylase [Clostridia bacterium]|nr:D-aminoacyl-tRNA deacylase [Clostridia bacterium]
MKAVLQRVSSADLVIDNNLFSSIKNGLVVLLGVEENDDENDVSILSEKVVNLRIFEDENEKMNNSLLQTNGEIMIVSNFTLCADCKKGRRPSFVKSEKPEKAKPLYEQFINSVKKLGVKKVAFGVFGADMQISLTNDGPVTIIIDSKDLKRK